LQPLHPLQGRLRSLGPTGNGCRRRTADSQPDLQGIWTLAIFTPLERPAHLPGKEFFTEEEAALSEELTADGADPLALTAVSEPPEQRQKRLASQETACITTTSSG